MKEETKLEVLKAAIHFTEVAIGESYRKHQVNMVTTSRTIAEHSKEAVSALETVFGRFYQLIEPTQEGIVPAEVNTSSK